MNEGGADRPAPVPQMQTSLCISERMLRRELRVLTLARIPAIPENKDDYGNIAPPESSAERSSP